MLTSVTLSAKNDALRKASTTQPMGLLIIPWPEKGVAGKGFYLHAAMDLEENKMLYCTVHVGSMLLLLLPCLIIHSVVFGSYGFPTIKVQNFSYKWLYQGMTFMPPGSHSGNFRLEKEEKRQDQNKSFNPTQLFEKVLEQLSSTKEHYGPHFR
jgi:hypothetical protein